MSYIDKILKEWSYRLSSGMPDINNSAHIWELKHILLEWRWGTNAIEELINSLQKVDKIKERKIISETITENESGKSVWQTKSGNWRGERPDGTRRSYDEKEHTVRWVAGEEDPDEKDDTEKDDSESTESKESSQNKSDRKERFKRGWKTGAPGRPGSMLNEEGSNHISEAMFDNPNMTEEEALELILGDIEGTHLEEQNESDSLAGDLKVGDMPQEVMDNVKAARLQLKEAKKGGNTKEIEKAKENLKKAENRKGVVSKGILAVRNAKRKTTKAKKFQKRLKWENAELMNFGGEGDDKKKQIDFIKGPPEREIVAYKNGKLVKVPIEKMEHLINSAGKGENSSDTSSILVNKDTGEVTVLFHSDKDSRTAQTGNSTQRDELTGDVTKKTLDGLVKKKVITQDQADKILDKRGAYAQRIDEIEDEFKTRATNVSTTAMNMLESGDVDAKDIIENFKKVSGPPSKDPAKYWKSRVLTKFNKDKCNERKKDGTLSSDAIQARRWLNEANPDFDSLDSGDDYIEELTEEQMLRAYLQKNSKEVPTGDDKAVLGRLNTGEDTPARQKAGSVVKGFEFTPDSAVEIEKIRTRALEMELQQNEDLNEQTVLIDGEEIGLGDYLASNNVWKFGHMGMLTQDEGTVYEYDDMFEINMSGHYLNKDVLAQCMRVDNKADFQKKFYVGDLVAQEDKDGNITGAGKILYFMRGDEKSDDDMIFQEKKIRTKSGPEGRASTVYNNGSDLNNCIDEHGKS